MVKSKTLLHGYFVKIRKSNQKLEKIILLDDLVYLSTKI